MAASRRPPRIDDGVSRDLARAALGRFEALLARRSSEAEFQRLFTASPFILSRTLPLRVAPHEIRPLGRPGRSEPDFIAFPDHAGVAGRYGVIELKRPDTSILTNPRRGSLILSRSAETAISQARLYRPSAGDQATRESLIMLGNPAVIVVIIGLGAELARKLSSEVLESQVLERLPPNCHLVPYDTLFRAFAETIPPRMITLVPEVCAMTLRSLVALVESAAPSWRGEANWWEMSEASFGFWENIETRAGKLIGEDNRFIDRRPFFISGKPQLGLATESDNFYEFNGRVGELLRWLALHAEGQGLQSELAQLASEPRRQ